MTQILVCELYSGISLPTYNKYWRHTLSPGLMLGSPFGPTLCSRLNAIFCVRPNSFPATIDSESDSQDGILCNTEKYKQLVGWQEGHPVCKTEWWDVGVVIWGEVQICIWPSRCHCHSLSLAPVNPDWFYLSALTFLVPAQKSRKMIVCVYVCNIIE